MANPTVQENQHPGTRDWRLRHFRLDTHGTNGSGLRSPWLEGYASDTSVYPGETIGLHISTRPARQFTVDFYRSGYYGGAGGRHMLHLGPIDGQPQEVPRMGMERVRECDWPVTTEVTIPDDWPAGVYLAKLTLVEGLISSYIVFIVKRREPADVLLQCSDLTWQAYNKWPGLDSLYDEGQPKRFNEYTYTSTNVRVSLDRPYALYAQHGLLYHTVGSGEYLMWEHPLAYWLEEQGYHVNYCSNLDAERDPGLLDRCKVFVSVGHDEYWTRAMYDHIAAARDNGMSIAFLSGNSVCFETAMYDSTVTGRPLRAMARAKYLAKESAQLMGSATHGVAYGDWTVRKPDHWLFEGTGMAEGEAIENLIGWEYHGQPLGDREGLEVVASSELRTFGTDRRAPQPHAATIYPGAKGGWVFNVGTIWWSQGLSSPPGHVRGASTVSQTLGPDPRVQRITKNFLDRAIGESPRR